VNEFTDLSSLHPNGYLFYNRRLCLDRLMRLMALSVRLILDVAYAPYTGKGAGERTLEMQILDRLSCFERLWLLLHQNR
jgi:hypothetical protein